MYCRKSLPIGFLYNYLPPLLSSVLIGVMVPGAIAQAQTVPAQSSEKPAPVQLHNQVSYSYDAFNEPQCVSTAGNNQNCIGNPVIHLQAISAEVAAQINVLIDPLGQITGCGGETLPSYAGFSLGLYEVNPSDPSGAEIGALVPLTATEFPDLAGNNIPLGKAPNTTNSNPFSLSSDGQGLYNFLLDVAKGQLDSGRAYILVINPPAGSIYNQRRIRIVFGSRNGNIVSYTATSLDGQPISVTGDSASVSSSINIRDAEQAGLSLAALNLATNICQSQAIQIIKTGDRAAASPGDAVIYRLSVRNLSSTAIANLNITDTPPLGFNILPKSVQAEINGVAVPVTTTVDGSAVTFSLPGVALPPRSTSDSTSVLNLAYAALLTPDAIRGTGKNSAIAAGQRADNRWSVKDGPSIHQLRIRQGLISDCGTIIGRVFVDKNFDGEQQSGEPGVPNSVIFLDDGTRITTDSKGLFSLANVLPGYRSGVLDLSSIPGYELAPNHHFSERNTPSRLVHLAPGSMVRMNFAVTPAPQKAGKE